jgi:hypothetical protein
MDIDRPDPFSEWTWRRAKGGDMATEMGLAARLKLAQEHEEHEEDAIVRTVAEETAKLPSDAFLWGALSALGMSLALFNAGRKADAMFVGQLATPILALGLYHRLVKPTGANAVHP